MNFRHTIAAFFLAHAGHRAAGRAGPGLGPAAPAATQEAAALAPAAAPAPAVSKETVDNPYGLKALWAQGDIVARAR